MTKPVLCFVVVLTLALGSTQALADLHGSLPTDRSVHEPLERDEAYSDATDTADTDQSAPVADDEFAEGPVDADENADNQAASSDVRSEQEPEQETASETANASGATEASSNSSGTSTTPTDVVVVQEAQDPHDSSKLNTGNGNAEAPVYMGGRENTEVSVVSWRDLPFQKIKKQTFDYSCGSAALATLLSYVYNRPTDESDVFKSMFDAGDKEKIRHEGFSLLDMKNYLNRLGYQASGFKMTYDMIQQHGVPFIALINRDGYNHFVVVKSVMGPLVLVGDPSRGDVITTREEFSNMWNGISLVVTNKASAARGAFADARRWRYAHTRAIASMGQTPGLDSTSLPFPNYQFAPSSMDVLSGLNSLTTAGDALSNLNP